MLARASAMRRSASAEADSAAAVWASSSAWVSFKSSLSKTAQTPKSNRGRDGHAREDHPYHRALLRVASGAWTAVCSVGVKSVVMCSPPGLVVHRRRDPMPLLGRDR